MKKRPLFLSVLLCLLYSVVYAQAPAIEWQKCFGGDFQDEGHYIEPTSDGGYIMTGLTGTFNNGDVHGFHGTSHQALDILVVKMDSKGTVEWTKCLGGSNDEQGAVVHQAPDGGYFVGGEEVSSMGDGDISTTHHGGYDIWVVKLNSAGNIVWSNTYGGQMDDRFHDLKITPDGGCIIVGTTSSTDGQVTGHHLLWDAWVLKVNNTGVLQWERCVGGSEDEEGLAVTVLTDGYAITGYSASTDGDMTGFPPLVFGQPEGMAAKLDLTGNILWVKGLGSSLQSGSGVTKGSDGGIVISGSNSKAALLKLDDNGNLLWSQYYGGSSRGDVFFSITVTPDGGYVMAGDAVSKDGDIKCPNATGSYQGWVVKVSSTGVLQWEKILSGGNTDLEYAVFPTSDGGYIVGGVTRESILSGYHTDIGNYYQSGDFYAAKLTPVPSTITINTPAVISCAGSPITLSLAGLPPGVGYSYQWVKNGTDISNNNPVYTASDLANGDQVFCVVTLSDACEVPITSNTVTLAVSPVAAPKVTISADAAAVCQGGTLTFTAAVAGGGQNPVYQWQVNGTNEGTNSNTYSSDKLIDGDVVSCRLSDASGCMIPASDAVTVTIYPTPSVGTAPPIVLPKGQSLVLSLPVTGNIATYSWSPAKGLSDATISDPLATPLKPVTYTLQVTSTDGCVASGNIMIKVFSQLAVPGAFSPNGDGHNDVFYILGGPLGSTIKDFAVFDRTGRCVFQVHGVAPNDPAFGWDGRVEGQPVAPGTYVYEIRMSFADGTQQVFKGTVVLVR